MEEKMDKKRDEKGRFKKGYFGGGPGRGHRKQFKPLDQDEFEGVIAEGLRSRDSKERAIWARVHLGYEKQRAKSSKQDEEGLDPMFVSFFSLLWDYAGAHRQQTGQPISMIDAMDIIAQHLKSCPNSPMGNVEFELGEFEEIDDDNK